MLPRGLRIALGLGLALLVFLTSGCGAMMATALLDGDFSRYHGQMYDGLWHDNYVYFNGQWILDGVGTPYWNGQ